MHLNWLLLRLVSLGKLRAINVFLAGDVFAPGSYSVSGLSTVLQVLYAGGGITEIGSLPHDIKVKRRGKVVAKLDAYDILLRVAIHPAILDWPQAIPSLSQRLRRLVSVDGEVKRPAIYETLATDTLGDLLQMSRGLSTQVTADCLQSERRVPGKSSVTRVQVDLDNAADLEQPLFDGDRLNVAAIKREVGNRILQGGAVAETGGYGYDGQRITDLLTTWMTIYCPKRTYRQV